MVVIVRSPYVFVFITTSALDLKMAAVDANDALDERRMNTDGRVRHFHGVV